MIQNTNRREFEIFLNSCPDDLVEVPAVGKAGEVGESENIDGVEEVEKS